VAWIGLVRLGSGSLSTSGPPSLPVQPVAEIVYVVQPGDTVWGIARSVEPDDDPRRTVDAILAARGNGSLQVGERIVLPNVSR
jgi:LysM repeat protein